jgi:uncharacterized protein YegJ (DUF2314 family)
MTRQEEDLVPVFMPALSVVLLSAEDRKGAPLDPEEVLAIRDKSPCIMMAKVDAGKLSERRGRDIDPENCWHDWQFLRRELGRQPDLDPGPKFNRIRSADSEYQQTIQEAQTRLDEFRRLLPADGSPYWDAMVKIKVSQDDNSAFMWLSNARIRGTGFVASFFEVPAQLNVYQVGDELEIAEAGVLDWSYNDNGLLHGGFSLRYQRARLPEEERASYDNYIGVRKYA